MLGITFRLIQHFSLAWGFYGTFEHFNLKHQKALSRSLQ